MTTSPSVGDTGFRIFWHKTGREVRPEYAEKRTFLRDEPEFWVVSAQYHEELSFPKAHVVLGPLEEDHAPYVTKTGKVLTDAELDVYVAEAEAGYDMGDALEAPDAVYETWATMADAHAAALREAARQAFPHS